jgi:hypothetical protein
MTTAMCRQTTISGHTVTYIQGDIDAFNVQNVGAKTVYNSPNFGCNGTFLDRPTGTLYGIAVGYGGVAVRTGSDVTANGYTRGTIVCFNPNGTSPKVASRFVLNKISDVGFPLSWIQWGIGGMSLYLQDTTLSTQAAFVSKVDSVEHGQSINGVDPESSTYDRTAIGYTSSGQIIIASVTAVSPYQLRSIMTSLGCYDAVMLDGADLSQLEGKTASGSNLSANSNTTDVWHMVTVSPTSWV